MEAAAPKIGEVASLGKFYLIADRESKTEVKIHFLIYRQEGPRGETGFAGISLEPGLFVWGPDPESARSQLFELTMQTVEALHESSAARNQFLEELGDGSLESYWGIYRQLAYLLGDPELKHINHLKNQIETKDQELSVTREQLREKEEHIAELKVTVDALERATREKIDA